MGKITILPAKAEKQNNTKFLLRVLVQLSAQSVNAGWLLSQRLIPPHGWRIVCDTFNSSERSYTHRWASIKCMHEEWQAEHQLWKKVKTFLLTGAKITFFFLANVKTSVFFWFCFQSRLVPSIHLSSTCSVKRRECTQVFNTNVTKERQFKLSYFAMSLNMYSFMGKISQHGILLLLLELLICCIHVVHLFKGSLDKMYFVKITWF